MLQPPFGLSGSPFAALRNDCSGEASSSENRVLVVYPPA